MDNVVPPPAVMLSWLRAYRTPPVRGQDGVHLKSFSNNGSLRTC
jgi:hypothetical protein